MIRRLVRAMIRGATVTGGEGVSLRVDPLLLRGAGILRLEEVEVFHHPTGERRSLFVEESTEGAGEVIVPHMRAGDLVTIVAWGLLHDGQTLAHKARVVTVDATNHALSITEDAV